MQTIQQATLADVPALNKLINSAYRDSSQQGWTNEAHLLEGPRSNEEMLSALLQEPGTTFLKYIENDEIIGCVRLDKQGKRLYLGLLTVLPKQQGGGIGKKLLKASEEEALQQECDAVFMTVLAARPELVAWYERHGYARTGEVQPLLASKDRLELLVLEKKVN